MQILKREMCRRNDLLQKALALDSRGETRNALSMFEELESNAANDNDKARALFYQSSCYLKMAKSGLARSCVRRAYTLNFDDNDIGLLLDLSEAGIDFQEGRFEDAAVRLRRLLQTGKSILSTPDYKWLECETQLRLALALTQAGFLDESIAVSTELSSMPLNDDDRESLNINLALSLAKTNRIAEADEKLRQILHRNPKNISARYQLSLLLFNSHRVREAKVELEKCKHAKSEAYGVPQSYILQLLVSVCEQLGQHDEAANYRKALIATP